MDKETELDNTNVNLSGLYELRINGLYVPTTVKSNLIRNDWDKLTTLGVKKIIYGIEGYVSLYIEAKDDTERETKMLQVGEIIRPYRIKDQIEHDGRSC